MSFDGKMSHAAHAQDSKRESWQVFLSQWVGMLSVVATGMLAYQLDNVSRSIKSHDKAAEMYMRINTTSSRVFERALALFEERQASREASELKLRKEIPVEELPKGSDSYQLSE